MRGRLGSAILLVLLILAGRTLWTEARRYHVRTVPEGVVPPAVPAGTVVIVTTVPAGRLTAGDIIDFRHPTAPTAALFLRVGSIERAAGSSGYLVRLDSGDGTREPWHAELHGAATRVVFNQDAETVSRAIDAGQVGIPAACVAGGALLLARRWYRHHPRGVARTYRTDIS